MHNRLILPLLFTFPILSCCSGTTEADAGELFTVEAAEVSEVSESLTDDTHVTPMLVGEDGQRYFYPKSIKARKADGTVVNPNCLGMYKSVRVLHKGKQGNKLDEAQSVIVGDLKDSNQRFAQYVAYVFSIFDYWYYGAKPYEVDGVTYYGDLMFRCPDQFRTWKSVLVTHGCDENGMMWMNAICGIPNGAENEEDRYRYGCIGNWKVWHTVAGYEKD